MVTGPQCHPIVWSVVGIGLEWPAHPMGTPFYGAGLGLEWPEWTPSSPRGDPSVTPFYGVRLGLAVGPHITPLCGVDWPRGPPAHPTGDPSVTPFCGAGLGLQWPQRAPSSPHGGPHLTPFYGAGLGTVPGAPSSPHRGGCEAQREQRSAHPASPSATTLPHRRVAPGRGQPLTPPFPPHCRRCSQRCARSANATACRAPAPCEPAGCACPPSEPWATSSRIASTAPPGSFTATKAATEPPGWSCTTWNPKTRPTNLHHPTIWFISRSRPISARPAGRWGRRGRRGGRATAPPRAWTAASCSAAAGGSALAPSASPSAATAPSIGAATSAASTAPTRRCCTSACEVESLGGGAVRPPGGGVGRSDLPVGLVLL